jgi:hypothetical protein
MSVTTAMGTLPIRRPPLSPQPQANWLEDTPEGDHFVGSYGRVFDVIAAAISSPRWFPVAAQAQRHDDRD